MATSLRATLVESAPTARAAQGARRARSCSRMGLIQGVTSQLTWNGRERARFSSQSSRELAPALTTAVRGMKIRLEGSVRPRAYGRAIRDRGLHGRTRLGRPFWTMRCERGLVIGPPLRLARVVP